MYILAKSVLALTAGFLVALVLGAIIVPFLRKKKMGQITSKFVKEHAAKAGTPVMGGLIFILSTVIVLAILLAIVIYGAIWDNKNKKEMEIIDRLKTFEKKIYENEKKHEILCPCVSF